MVYDIYIRIRKCKSCLRGVRSLSEEVPFKIVFRSKSPFADKTYLENMITEILTSVAKNTAAFEFDVQYLGEEDEDD